MRGSLIFVVVATGLSLSSRVDAQSEPQLPQQYLSVKLGLSVAGSLSASSDAVTLKHDEGEPAVTVAPVDSKGDLQSPSFAAEVDYIFALHRYFGLGALLGFQTWHSKPAADLLKEGGSYGFDAGAVLQPRLPIGSNFELYLSIPLSLTLSLLNEYKTWTELPHGTQGTAESVGPTFGLGLGVLVGARYALGSHFGLLLELGYQRYMFTHTVQFQISEEVDHDGSGTGLGLNLVTQQFRINAGVFF
jgi:hypothetical protein